MYVLITRRHSLEDSYLINLLTDKRSIILAYSIRE